MAFFRRFTAAALCCALAGPAFAASTPYTLTQSWQKIASSGSTVDVQNVSSTPALITTSSGAPAAGTGGQILQSGEHRLYTLSGDLYALGSGTVQVTDGVATGSGGGSGGTVTTAPAAGTPSEASTSSAPLAGLNSLEVSPAASGLGLWFAQNQSASTLTVVLCNDTGSATPCSSRAGTLLLGPGGAGLQGGAAGSQDTGPWKGRIDVYGPASSQHTLVRQ